MATTGPHRWHSIFADAYSDTPAIVLGASLREEIDLQTVLERGRLGSRDAPSIIVLKTMDEFDREEYKRWGLIPIEATAEEMLRAIAEDWPRYALQYAPDGAEDAAQISPRQLSFLRQWERIDPPAERAVDPKHDFYAGHEPIYNDILEQLDFARNGFATLRDEFLKQELLQMVACIYGTPFSGKTCVALRLCRSMAEDGWIIYNFDQELRPDLEAIVWWIRRSPKTVLYAEGIADFAPEIGELLERCINEGLPLRVIAVERESRMREVRRSLHGGAVREWRASARLDTGEINRLITALKKHARLGVITGLSRAAQREYFFKTHKRELFSGLSGLEGGEGFLERVHRRLADVGAGTPRTVAHLTAIVSSFGYGLPFGIAMSAAGISPTELTRMLETEAFADIIAVRRNRLYPRHRVFGSYLMDREFSRDENFATTIALARHLAPHISPAAIAEKTLEYRLARQLLDWEDLVRWLGKDQLLTWYATVQDLYDWNARYWEQRALAASDQGRHERAMSWARRAIVAHRDAFALNTLATVILRRGLAVVNNRDEQMGFYLEATAFLEEARAMAEADSEYPYITFFKYTADFARAQRTEEGTVDTKISRRWSDWWRFAQESDAFRTPEGQSTLRNLQRDWLRTTV